jgi:hypothetical protein
MHVLFHINAVFKLIKQRSQCAMLFTLCMQYLHFLFMTENRKQEVDSVAVCYESDRISGRNLN